MGQMSLSIWLLTDPLLPELLNHHHFPHLNNCHHHFPRLNPCQHNFHHHHCCHHSYPHPSYSLFHHHHHFNAVADVDSNDYDDDDDADDDAYQVPINQSSRAGVPEAVVKRAIA